MKEQLINEVATDKRYNELCRNITGNDILQGDLKSEIILALYKQSEEKIKSIEEGNYLLFWAARVAWQMWNVPSTEFYKKYRKFAATTTEITFNEEADSDNTQQSINADISKILDGEAWFDKELFKIYMKEGSLHKVSNKTRIIRQTVTASVNRVRENIKRKMEVETINILIVCGQHLTGSDYYRTITPHAHLNKTTQFHVERIPTMDIFNVVINGKPIDIADFIQQRKFHFIFFSRSISNMGRETEIISMCHAAGTKVILDIDDYWMPGSGHILHDQYRMIGVHQRMIDSMRMVDAVITTNDVLASEIARINKRVYVLPNAINPNDSMFINRYQPATRTRIGWMGGICHREDIDMLRDSIHQIYSDDELHGRFQFILAGFNLLQNELIKDVSGNITEIPVPFDRQEYVHFERIFSNSYNLADKEYKKWLLSKRVGHYQYENGQEYKRMYGRSAEEYAEGYNEMDICIAPLKDNKFNKCKSQLKLIEAGFFRKSIIVSNIHPYTIDGIHGENCLMVDEKKGHKQWAKYIKQLINDREMREHLGNNLYYDVQKYHIEEVNKQRALIYRQLL